MTSASSAWVVQAAERATAKTAAKHRWVLKFMRTGRLEGDENSVKAFGSAWTMISNQPVGQVPFIPLQLFCGVLPGGSISLDSQSIVISESDSAFICSFQEL